MQSGVELDGTLLGVFLCIRTSSCVSEMGGRDKKEKARGTAPTPHMTDLPGSGKRGRGGVTSESCE